MFLNQEDQVFWIYFHLKLKYCIFYSFSVCDGVGFSFFAKSACLLYAISINQSL